MNEVTLEPVLLTRKQLANKLSLSTRSIDNLQARGVIRFIRITQRCVRYDLNHVMEDLSKFEVSAE